MNECKKTRVLKKIWKHNICEIKGCHNNMSFATLPHSLFPKVWMYLFQFTNARFICCCKSVSRHWFLSFHYPFMLEWRLFILDHLDWLHAPGSDCNRVMLSWWFKHAFAHLPFSAVEKLRFTGCGTCDSFLLENVEWPNLFHLTHVRNVNHTALKFDSFKQKMKWQKPFLVIRTAWNRENQRMQDFFRNMDATVSYRDTRTFWQRTDPYPQWTKMLQTMKWCKVEASFRKSMQMRHVIQLLLECFVCYDHVDSWFIHGIQNCSELLSEIYKKLFPLLEVTRHLVQDPYWRRRFAFVLIYIPWDKMAVKLAHWENMLVDPLRIRDLFPPITYICGRCLPGGVVSQKKKKARDYCFYCMLNVAPKHLIVKFRQITEGFGYSASDTKVILETFLFLQRTLSENYTGIYEWKDLIPLEQLCVEYKTNLVQAMFQDDYEKIAIFLKSLTVEDCLEICDKLKLDVPRIMHEINRIVTEPDDDTPETLNLVWSLKHDLEASTT